MRVKQIRRKNRRVWTCVVHSGLDKFVCVTKADVVRIWGKLNLNNNTFFKNKKFEKKKTLMKSS